MDYCSGRGIGLDENKHLFLFESSWDNLELLRMSVYWIYLLEQGLGFTVGQRRQAVQGMETSRR